MGCDQQINLVVGDTITGVFQLRKKVNGVINPYPLVDGAVIDIHFPAFDNSAPVVLSTANTGEVTIIDATLSTISFLGSTAKSSLLNPGNMQTIDVVITNPDMTQYTFNTGQIVYITQRANA